MRKLIYILLVLILALTGCTNKEADDSGSQSGGKTSQETSTQQATEANLGTEAETTSAAEGGSNELNQSLNSVPSHIGENEVDEFIVMDQGDDRYISLKMGGSYIASGALIYNREDENYYFVPYTEELDARPSFTYEYTGPYEYARGSYEFTPPQGPIKVKANTVKNALNTDYINHLLSGYSLKTTFTIDNYQEVKLFGSDTLIDADMVLDDYEDLNFSDEGDHSSEAPEFISGKKVVTYTLNDDEIKIQLAGSFSGLKASVYFDELSEAYQVYVPDAEFETFSFYLGGELFSISPPSGIYNISENDLIASLGKENKAQIDTGSEVEVTLTVSNYGYEAKYLSGNYVAGDIQITDVSTSQITSEKTTEATKENETTSEVVTATTSEQPTTSSPAVEDDKGQNVVVSGFVAVDGKNHYLNSDDIVYFSNPNYTNIGQSIRLEPSDYDKDATSAPMAIYLYGQLFGKDENYPSLVDAENIKYQIDITFNDEGTGNAGIVYNTVLADDGVDDFIGYYVGISPASDQVLFRKATNGTWEKLDTIDLDFDVKEFDTVTLTVYTHQTEGTHVYVNDKFVGSVPASSPKIGYFGIRSWKASATFSHFTIE